MSQYLTPSTQRIDSIASPEGGQSERRTPRWSRFASLKIEAAIFLLVAITFAAILGQSAITSRKLDLTPTSGQFYPYNYADKDNGGTSFVKPDDAHPLAFDCSLGKGFQYPYCGYGLSFDLGNTGKGQDFRHFNDITLRFKYHGEGQHLKLILKARTPAALKAKVPEGEISLASEFDVRDGDNTVHLSMESLSAEQWWVTQHHLTPEEATVPLDKVIAVALNSADQPVPSQFHVAFDSINFEGAFLTTDQWYLVILAVWLVATGGFLVFRFLNVRKAYEARQGVYAQEAKILADARAVAEDASAAKSQFLANMSHELRTPLNAIIGYAQLLRTRDYPGEDQNALKTIEHSGQHLLTMITDILDIAKVEAGKLDLLPAGVDLHACVQSAGQMIRLRAEEKGLSFVVAIAEDVPATIFTDQKRLRQVLINLLGNAIKFTSHGEVRLDVSLISTQAEIVRLRFAVSDTGLGIEKDHIERIFRPFEQSGNSVDRSGGTGLGLSITRKILEMMGGEISVESELGKGSRFIVDAEFALTGADDADAPVLVGDANEFEILLVDDSEASISLLKSALKGPGFGIRVAGDGQQALEQLDVARPDLVIMDVKMPNMGGIEAIRRIRERPDLVHLPIIAITGNPSAEIEAAVKAAGAELMIGKPLDLRALAAHITGLLNSRTAMNEVSDHRVIVAPSGETYDRILLLAREGHLRALRKELPTILALGPQYRPFVEKLDQLAAAYQSPAVLRLIETAASRADAA